MKEFTLKPSIFKNEDEKCTVEMCVEQMLILKETEKYNHYAIQSLLTAYLQLPVEDIHPDQKQQIAEVCTNLGRVFESLRMSHLTFYRKPYKLTRHDYEVECERARSEDHEFYADLKKIREIKNFKKRKEKFEKFKRKHELLEYFA